MTALQKVQLRLSEIRKRMAELGGLETLTEEQTTEIEQLRAEYGECETRQQALLVAQEGEETEETTEETAEEREYQELVAGASISEVVVAAVEGRATDGQTAELQQHHELRGNQIPLDLLMESPAEREEEYRTAGVTPAPADVGAMPHPIIPMVFPMGILSFLSIPQDRCMVGEKVYTVLSTGAAPGTPAKGAEQGHTEGAFSVQTLAPARIQASMFYAREDAARLAGLDAALRQNLNEALSDKLDEEVIDDLLTGNTLSSDDAAAADSYDTYVKRFGYTQVDGKYANDITDLRLAVGTDTYGDMATSFANDQGTINALRVLSGGEGGQMGRRVRVTPHAPATSADHKQHGLVRRGMRRDYAVGIWEGVTIIVDEVTQAKEGEIILTAVMLHAKSLLRAAGFKKIQAQHQ